MKLYTFALLLTTIGLTSAGIPAAGCGGGQALILENNLEVETLSTEPCDPTKTCKTFILIQKVN
jgi:hypothetical protein